MRSDAGNRGTFIVATREDFIRAICAAPDDDAPRLVFADWLEENGDPNWGQFIRLSCELARHPQDDEEARRLSDRCDTFHSKVEHRLLEELRVFKGFDWRIGAPRGLFEVAFVSSPKTLIAEADRIWSLTCLRDLTLHNPTAESLAAVLALPHLACLTGLTITGPAADADAVKAIVASPHLTRLTALGFEGGRNGRFTGTAARVLAGSPFLDRLTRLDLKDNSNLDPASAPVRALRRRCQGRCELLLPPARKRR
jgi:uncharacterized protein (TIGR02996 family)